MSPGAGGHSAKPVARVMQFTPLGDAQHMQLRRIARLHPTVVFATSSLQDVSLLGLGLLFVYVCERVWSSNNCRRERVCVHVYIHAFVVSLV